MEFFADGKHLQCQTHKGSPVTVDPKALSGSRTTNLFSPVGSLTLLQIETELTNTCNEILKVLDDHLIKKAVDADEKVFYRKM